ncbi:hypothetical protein AB656_04885 [Bifidobacterium actinocoloniiforme DSM 22766]|nr:hypothetical protein AB656_04885 [Bifidobacterium actinocoloniiforme DSM 22766]
MARAQAGQRPQPRPENYYRLVKQAINKQNRKLDRFVARYDLTASQASIIDHLSTCPGHAASQSAIEAEFDIQGSTLTVMLQRMEAKGLLERAASTADARRKTVHLTPKSERLIPAISAYIDRQQLRFEREFGRARLADFKRMIAYMAASIGLDDDQPVDKRPPL